jgi:NAD(P)-dependent dehydrogenase (short-subunit alcohol dehydrogenase family)
MKRRIVITGATSGIGLETAKSLLGSEYDLILACRNLHKAREVWNPIIDMNPEASVRYEHLDLASFRSIEQFAEIMNHDYSSIDVLVNNAGVFMDTAQKTEEGFEMTVGVNYLGTYYLTIKLQELLKHGQSPQIINICSKAALYGRIKVSDLLFKEHPHGFKAYSASKRMLLMATKYFSKHFSKDEITVNAVHPGKVATGIWNGESLLMKLIGPINLRRYDSPEKAAKVGLFLIENEKMWHETGGFFEKLGDAILMKKSVTDNQKIQELINLTERTIALNTPAIELEK